MPTLWVIRSGCPDGDHRIAIAIADEGRDPRGCEQGGKPQDFARAGFGPQLKFVTLFGRATLASCGTSARVFTRQE